MNQRLQELHKLGQSPWLDQIDRKSIQDGTLKRIFEEGILGVTTNPTIFEKSISGSRIYDTQIEALVRENKSPEEIYDDLTVSDVAGAADLLKDIFRDSGGRDGFVSIEAWPKFAHDAERTINYALKIFKTINRPNIMIKVPGTTASSSVISSLIAQGVNVNVTLLFSVSHYEPIASTYIEGLRLRLKNNLPLSTVNSVASIFVSRIDTKVDKILEGLADKEFDAKRKEKILFLRGKAAIATSTLIYAKFKEIFSQDNFGSLKSNGAHIQRLLWASTSTKNPSYSDIKYVDELIVPDTINTMPLPTIEAFKDHGSCQIAIDDDFASAKRIIQDLESLGIDIEKICQELQDEGLKLFSDSFESVIKSIQSKILLTD